MAGLDWAALGPIAGVLLTGGFGIFMMTRTLPITRRSVDIIDRATLEKIVADLRGELREMGDDLDSVRKELNGVYKDLQAERASNLDCRDGRLRLERKIVDLESHIRDLEKATTRNMLEQTSNERRITELELDDDKDGRAWGSAG